MSRKSESKKARRRKRQASRNERWIPDTVMDAMSEDIELAAALEAFDQRISKRGWQFDEVTSDEESVLWFYPPSHNDLAGDEMAPETTILLTSDEDGDIAHVIFVGTVDDYQFDLDELFDHIDAIEAYRLGDPVPAFDS